MWWGCGTNTCTKADPVAHPFKHTEGKQSSEMHSWACSFFSGNTSKEAGICYLREWGWGGGSQRSVLQCHLSSRYKGSGVRLAPLRLQNKVPHARESSVSLQTKTLWTPTSLYKSKNAPPSFVGQRRLTPALPASAQTPVSLPSASLSAFLLPRFSIHSHIRLLTHSGKLS